MVTEEEISDLTNKVENLHYIMTQSLPPTVNVGSLGVVSKGPFKALIVREALFFRTEELVHSALILLKEGNVVAAILLARAVMESTALQHKLLDVIKSRTEYTIATLDDILMRLLMGFKADPEFPKVFHIMDLIRTLDKSIIGYEDIYGLLSEFAHPNSNGVARAYTERGKDQFGMNFTKNPERIRPIQAMCLTAIEGALAFYLIEYDEIADLMPVWLAELEKF